MQNSKIIYILLFLFMAGIVIAFSLNVNTRITHEDNDNYISTHIYNCIAARRLVNQYFDEITAVFVRNSNRPHDDVDPGQLSLGYGFRLVDIRCDIRDVYQDMSYLQDIFVYSNDWLFIINHKNIPRGYVIVRNIMGKYSVRWPEPEHIFFFNDYDRFDMSSRKFWHFDEVMKRYGGEFNTQSMKVFYNGFEIWLINEQYNVIVLDGTTFGAMRRGEPLIMDGDILAEMLAIELLLFNYRMCHWHNFDMPRYRVWPMWLNLLPVYLAYTGPAVFEPSPPLQSSDVFSNVILEITDIRNRVVSLTMSNYSDYPIITSPYFRIEYFDGSEWLNIQFRIQSHGMSSHFWRIDPGENMQLFSSLLPVYPIPAGLYRIRKEIGSVNAPRTKYDIVAEFYFNKDEMSD